MPDDSRVISTTATPLCVDLDDALIQGQLRWEAVMVLLARNALYALPVAVWRLKGKAHLERELATRVSLEPRTLPFNSAYLSYLRTQFDDGRQIVLITSVDRKWAEPIARHIGVFSEVLANADRKKAVLDSRYGPQGYDRAVDPAVPAGGAHTTGRVLKAIRVHQWVKNFLIFLPVVTSHRFNDSRVMIQAMLALTSFSFCASSVYVINDLLDLPNDRLHSTKRRRPFAAGDLSIPTGLALVLALLAGSAFTSLWLPGAFQLLLAFYFCLTLAYSLSLKRKMLVDIFTLAGLYTLRVLAGSAATGIEPSPWLLAFCLFFFLSLALVKRFTELREMKEDASRTIAGRGYSGSDLQAIGSLGTSSGFMCVLVLALYINSPQVLPLYRSPYLLWFLCPVIMYWISRVWLMAYRGTMNEDPVLFAIRDRVSYLTAACCAAVLTLAAKGLHF